MNKQKFLIFIYGIFILGLFFYSFTQIDLSLTFSRIDFLRHIATSFQYIGYFNRPLSTNIYIALVVLLYGFYFYFIKLAVKKNITKKLVWKIVLFTAVILAFSYNAFSYDLFNYIFDAKIITHYQQNPYLHKALDFQGDPMLSFMRWTHRTYPYGPVWLLLTVPLSFIGSNFFLPTFFLFKFLIAASFLGSLYFVGKILQKIAPDRELAGLVFFGLNPLVLIESLVSSHLDIVMVFFLLWAFYNLINKKYLLTLVLLILSIGIKFATVFLLPMLLLAFVLQRMKKSIDWKFIFHLSVIVAAVTVFIASVYSGNFQPWYLILPLSVAVFISNSFYIFIPTVIISFFALLNYVPYLYLGNWNPPVPYILNQLNWLSYISSFLAVIIYFSIKRFNSTK